MSNPRTAPQSPQVYQISWSVCRGPGGGLLVEFLLSLLEARVLSLQIFVIGAIRLKHLSIICGFKEAGKFRKIHLGCVHDEGILLLFELCVEFARCTDEALRIVGAWIESMGRILGFRLESMSCCWHRRDSVRAADVLFEWI